MMPPHFFHTLETIFEFPEEEKKKTKEYEEDVCVDRIRNMTPSKSLKEEKQNMKKNRKSLGKEVNTFKFSQVKSPGTENINENNKPSSWIPKVLGKITSKIEEQKAKQQEKQVKQHWEKVLKEWN